MNCWGLLDAMICIFQYCNESGILIIYSHRDNSFGIKKENLLKNVTDLFIVSSSKTVVDLNSCNVWHFNTNYFTVCDEISSWFHWVPFW